MTEPPKTVDNVGLNVSTDWALRQAELDKGKGFAEEGKKVQGQAQIDVVQPSYLPEWEALLGNPERYQPISGFASPPDYNVQRRGLFTMQLCPRLGVEAKLEEQVQRIEQTAPAAAVGGALTPEQKTEQKEKTAITDLLNLNIQYGKYSADFYGRRDQYQRG